MQSQGNSRNEAGWKGQEKSKGMSQAHLTPSPGEIPPREKGKEGPVQGKPC